MPKRRRKRGRRGKTCIEAKSPFRQTVFYERDRRWHEDKHPELKSQDFLEQVRKTISRPWKIYRSFYGPGTVVFYSKIGEVATPLTSLFKFRYAKVVVALKKHEVNVVKTAFGVNHIKERVEVSIRI